MSIEDCGEKDVSVRATVEHGHSNRQDKSIALEPFRRSASGRNKLLL